MRVNLGHESDLVAPFLDVILVDAYGVDPEQPEGGAEAGSFQHRLAACCDLKWLVIDQDGALPGSVAISVGPCVGNGLVLDVVVQAAAYKTAVDAVFIFAVAMRPDDQQTQFRVLLQECMEGRMRRLRSDNQDRWRGCLRNGDSNPRSWVWCLSARGMDCVRPIRFPRGKRPSPPLPN
jgi:hypothetical protein